METVLVVESDAITRCCWSEALRHQGYHVVEVQDPSEAFQREPLTPELLSALLLEVPLSDLKSNMLACRLKEANPKLCVIASSTLRFQDLPDGLPCDALLAKPASPKQVLALVEQLLHEATPNCGMRVVTQFRDCGKGKQRDRRMESPNPTKRS